MQTSSNIGLDHRDPEQQSTDRSEQSPPDVYFARLERLQAASAAWSARMRAKREARKKRRDVG